MSTFVHVITRIENSGPNQVMRELCLEMVRRNHRVVCLSCQPERDDPQAVDRLARGGVEIGWGEQHRGARLFEVVRKIRTYQAADKSTIYHCHCLRSQSMILLAACRWKVAHSHNIPSEEWILGKGMFIGSLIAALNYLTLRRMNLVFSISDAMKRELEKRGISSVVVLNPVAPMAISSPTDHGDVRVRLLTVGALIDRKNQVLLLSALKEMGDAARRFRLQIVGDGPRREYLESQAIGCQADVEFVGFVPDPGPYFERADYYVSPSISEGMPISVLEALSSGIPCLLSRIGGHDFVAAPESSVVHFEVSATSLASTLLGVKERPSAALRSQTAKWAISTLSPAVVVEKVELAYSEMQAIR